MTDHIGAPNAMICHHCGLPADRNQNGIQGYRCGSSYCESFRPQWARSMTCLEIENGQLREMFRKANLHALDLAEHIKRMKVAGDAMAHDHNPFTYMDWQRAKEAKP
jgi:hypothetical protein